METNSMQIHLNSSMNVKRKKRRQRNTKNGRRKRKKKHEKCNRELINNLINLKQARKKLKTKKSLVKTKFRKYRNQLENLKTENQKMAKERTKFYTNFSPTIPNQNEEKIRILRLRENY